MGLVGTLIAVHAALQNGTVIRYLDSHPHPTRVPAVEYVIGTGYYVFGDLETSATYYQRIAERYPQSNYADDAYFNYLQSLDDLNTNRHLMADAYHAYMERFPQGKHFIVAQKREEFCRNAR